MTTIGKIKEKAEWITAKPLLAILVIVIGGTIMRVYFTPWNYPSEAADTYVYLTWALSFSKGSLEDVNTNYLIWPLFLSVFFVPFEFQDYFGYLSIMRIVSILISVATIPVVYLAAKYFVEKRFALLAAVFFAIEPNLIENSIYGITEPMFILLGMISFYFAVQKNDRYLLLGFLFAGLAFDTRVSGIVLVILMIVACIVRNKEKKLIVRNIGIGMAIVFVVVSPYLYTQLSSGTAPFAERIERVESSLTSLSPHLYGPASIFYELQNRDVEEVVRFDEVTETDVAIFALLKEAFHVLRISLPYLIVLVPIGIWVAFQNINSRTKILLGGIIISLVVAFPQYTTSAVFRNLFFLIPLFCILSSMGIERISRRIKMQDILIVLLVLGTITASSYFLHEQMSFDSVLVEEKTQFGKFVTNNFKGTFIGDNYNFILPHLVDVNADRTFNSKDGFTIYAPLRIFMDVEDLIQFGAHNKVTHIIVDDIYDSRYPIFQEIFLDEKDFPQLIKVFDSQEENYKKYKVKIFKINYSD